jgi:hypothetical protein
MIERTHLGSTDYFNKPAEAYREEYPDYSLFVLYVEGERIVLMRY